MKKAKILVILGVTSSGKSSLAVELAKKFNGEIISADSRQIYRGLDIGTGKVTKKEIGGIPHYLIDVIDPNEKFSVVDFKRLADKRIGKILAKGKLPIIAGGTGFYISSIVEGITYPEVKPNKELRKKMENKWADELLNILKTKDPEKAKKIDSKNKRRIIRAIEIAESLGKNMEVKKDPQYEVLQIGLEVEDKELKERIKKRIDGWFKEGLIEEGKRLKENGLSWGRFMELGLEYRNLAWYLQGKMSKEEVVDKMNTETFQYAKRQRTWFKKDKKIKWFKEPKKVQKEVGKFLLKGGR
jgi:tRNA dimethylallyltransferase